MVACAPHEANEDVARELVGEGKAAPRIAHALLHLAGVAVYRPIPAQKRLVDRAQSNRPSLSQAEVPGSTTVNIGMLRASPLALDGEREHHAAPRCLGVACFDQTS
jgi:hypothetical protein